MAGKERFVHKFIEKFERIDPRYVEAFLTRLSSERNFLEDLMNLIDQGIVVLDSEKSIILINTAAMKILNITNEDPSGKPIKKYLIDPRLEIFFDKVWDLTDKSVNTEITLEYPRPMLLGVTIINYRLSDPDNFSSKVFVFSDLSDREKKLAEVLKNEKMNTFNLLSAGIAHEIGNPLNSLDIHMQLLQKELEDIENERKADIVELTEVAREEIGRLDSIIKRFLKAVRPFQINLREEDIKNTINKAISGMSLEISAEGISVEVVFTKEIPKFLYDPDLIEQAFRNIIKNAIQAMPDGGKITIKAEVQKEMCKICITDTGKGIAMKDLKHIFDPYFTTREEGTGLGLMIVNRIIVAHDGEISVMSEENEGTTIVVSLPLKMKANKFLPEH